MNATSDSGVGSITLLPLLYSLDMECPVPWPSQTDYVNQDYPFQYVFTGSGGQRSKLKVISDMKQESSTEFLMRLYLETLWLPEVGHRECRPSRL